MSEKKVFVITMSTGSYDDQGTEVIGITEDYIAGLKYVNEKNVNFQTMNKKAQSFYEKEQLDWIQKNPRPLLNMKDITKFPNFKSNQKVTEEMKENRKKLELKNKEILEKNNALMKEWGQKFDSFSTDYFKTNLTKEEYEVYLINNDNYWSIEETKWFKF